MDGEEVARFFQWPKFRSYNGVYILVTIGLLAVIGSNNLARAGNASSGLDELPTNSTCVAPNPPPTEGSVKLKKVFTKLEFEQPAAMVQPPQDSSIWYLAERPGKIRVFDNDSNVNTDIVALDLGHKFEIINHANSGPNVESQQWGITSIALDPAFGSNGYLYIAYNTKVEETGPVFSFVSRFTLAPGKHTFNPTTEKIIVRLQQDTPWHHMGQIAFGRDGLLYIGSGDGNHKERAQDANSLHGKILRINVHSSDSYDIPTNNPFSAGGGAPEVFAWGIRNPWRFSFDRKTGALFVGDVGWRTAEEINIVEVGKNYGWPVLEGTQCVIEGCDQSGLVPPIHEYLHTVGKAVIGGFTYRGNAILDLKGTYVFGDVSNGFWKLEKEGGNTWIREDVLAYRPHSFAEDNEGELYVFRVDEKGIRKIVPQTSKDESEVGDVLAKRLSQTGCVNPSDPPSSTELFACQLLRMSQA